MPVGILGKKLGQTRVYDAKGVATAVTVVLAGPNRVLQCKTQQSDGYNAVQLGFDDQKEQRLTKPLAGHIKKFNGQPVKRIREFRNFSKEVKPGDVVGAALFEAGDYVDAIGLTKGRGFEGVVKRHRFAGGDSTHGAKGWHRRSGAIGQRLFPGTVMRGMRMPGHMGQVRRTVQNLQVMQVRAEENLLLIKGAIPGAKGDYVIIRESKKRPKGWKPHAERPENVEKAKSKKK
ncbi:MAG TPA: 50S ribosomal protein L3 [Verrucomicrobiota bacterium]|jgi:large subunit ribosomal protein L3|nr:50S ribosomal protein L3 [Verrucomicrobiota bacterium]HRT06825.1 50S ribosomal protein L3 [Candidatus Paceibacterota bacterium]HRT55704.1 50S ribosomal protein L3 [Candidatus Paceibacterota bacterium]